MQGFKADYLEIQPSELVHFLLQASGQYDRGAVSPSDLLKYLKLQCLAFDFDTNPPPGARPRPSRPRALLSFPDRLIAVDETLTCPRRKFSLLHEVAHYVLPAHRNSLYLCDELGMSPWARLAFEKEANEFAADLLFKGSLFAVDVAGMDISVRTVVELAGKYEVSFEATARRLVEKSLRPAMLAVFKSAGEPTETNVSAGPVWEVRYCAASPTFKSRFSTGVNGNVPADVASELLSPGRDIEESIVREMPVGGWRMGLPSFRAEFFYNQYNILCLLTPQRTPALPT